jgi:hypothetical protein
MDIDMLNKVADKYRSEEEKKAFFEGARAGFSLAMQEFNQELHEAENRRITSSIIIEENKKRIIL